VQPTSHEQADYWRELGEGLRFLRNDSLLLAIVVTVMVVNGLDAAFGGVVQPFYVKTLYGSALDLGLLVSMNGGGAVVGALLFAAIGHKLPRRIIFLAGFLLVSVRYWAYLAYPTLPFLLLATFITSIGAGPINPIIDAVKFEHIPSGMRGRVFGTIQAGAWSAMPLGMLAGGFLTQRFGLQAVLVGLGLTYLLVTSSMAFIPAMRGIERPAQFGPYPGPVPPVV
jgi:MFS family permease